MRDLAIMSLDGLQNDGEMTCAEIAAATGLDQKSLQNRLNALVRLEQLYRIPGIASVPTKYKLKRRATHWPFSAARQRAGA